MNRKAVTNLIATFVVCCTCYGNSDRPGINDGPTFPKRPQTMVENVTHKALRGFINVVTGWGEIPRQMIRTGRSDGLLYTLPLGVPRGLIMGLIRTGTGLVELVFPFDSVTGNYDPMLLPAYVWDPSCEPIPAAPEPVVE